ncbi:MAG: thioredoxin family protein, partial [Pseudomonadota bacterium]
VLLSLALIISLGLSGILLGLDLRDKNPQSSPTTIINAENWSLEKLSSQDRFIFMDFTAQWCLNCKVNELLIIKTKSFQELLKKHNVLFLVGDWTKEDPVIGKWLKEHGASGVPAYFIQDKKGKITFLGETVFRSEIEKILQQD